MMVLYLRKLLKPLLEYYNDWKTNQNEYNHFRNLLKSFKKKHLINKTIVFNTVRCVKSQLDREFYLGKNLALNGAKVILLLDDGIMKHTETYQFDNVPDVNKLKTYNLNPYPNFRILTMNAIRKLQDKILLNKALNTYKERNLEVLFYSKILKKINYENWQSLKKYAISSTMRFFKTSVLDFNNDIVEYYYKLSLLNSIFSRNVGEYVLNNIKPDYYITSHAIYSSWGPIFQYLFDNGIKTLVYSSAHAHSLNPQEWFFSNRKIFFLSQSKQWLTCRNNPVTEDMIKEVEDYYKNRRKFSAADTKFLYPQQTTSFTINKNDGYKYHIALFPNVIWDGNIQDRHLIFDSYLDWIISTINHVKGRKDLILYIKSHPSEITVLKNSAKFVDVIKDLTSLKENNNIVLIPPEEQINTYKFLQSGIDLAITYDGFLALEIPFLKIPTIMCVKGGMFYVENGQLNPKSKEEYFQFLDDIKSTITIFQNSYTERYSNLIKYSYWYIFQNAIKLPILKKSNYIHTDLTQLKQSDLILEESYLKLIK